MYTESALTTEPLVKGNWNGLNISR